MLQVPPEKGTPDNKEFFVKYPAGGRAVEAPMAVDARADERAPPHGGKDVPTVDICP